MTMQSLIVRLEAASGPDRELDGRIWCALNGYPFVQWDGAGCVYRGRDGIGHIAHDHIREWTRSIDASMTLVPDGWSWKLLHEPKYTRVYRVVVRGASTLAEVAPAYVISSPTPALALCIAALRARCSVSSPDRSGDA